MRPVPVLQVASTACPTRAEGPFTRFALWVSGCTLRCPGCCNPELSDPTVGERVEVAALLHRLEAAMGDGIEGITLLGGEPTEQIGAVTSLCEGARRLGLGVVLFSGRTHAELATMPRFEALANAIDTLVDGRFDFRQPEQPGGRRFLGSTNQTLHHFTARYADPKLWRGGQRVDVRIDPDGSVHVHGFPRPTRDLLRALGRRPLNAVSDKHGEERQTGARVLADEERTRRVLHR